MDRSADRAGPEVDRDPDSLFLSYLHLQDFSAEGRETDIANMDNATLFQFTPPPTAHPPRLRLQNFPPLAAQPWTEEVMDQGIPLLITPLEPAGPHYTYPTSGPPGGVGQAEAVSSFLEDTVFKFPDIIPEASALLSPQRSSWLVPPGFTDIGYRMETPPDTPTDPHSLFDYITGHRHSTPSPHLSPHPLSPSSPILGTFLSFLNTPVPPRRQRLQGTSGTEEDDLQDLDVLEDLVFSDTEMPATETALECFQQIEAGGGLEESPPTPPTLLAGQCRERDSREAGPRGEGPQGLLKELRQKIIRKRQDNGQEELKVIFTEPTVCQMTEADETRRNVRRAQNRGAARRFRLKKKVKDEEIKKKVEENLKTNARLHREVAQLRAETARLQAVVRQHAHCCPMGGAGHGGEGPLPLHAPAGEDLLLLDLPDIMSVALSMEDLD
ncbi:hypothetical protein ACOMHN_058696 [Nucella lapillus]